MPCLTKDTSKKFLDAIRSGAISPETMIGSPGKMVSSKQRQAILGSIVGPENVPWVNAALESKILLKDQQRGMVSWAKKTPGLTEPARRDLISKIQKETKVFDPETSGSFLESLAAKKLGHEITFAEAKNISALAQAEKTTKAKIKESDPFRSQSRLEYGLAVTDFKDYVGELKHTAGKLTPMGYLKHPVHSLYQAAGVAKSMLSTLDNSFFGRQGIKMFFTNTDIWAKTFAKSWVDIGKELVGIDAMKATKADVFSRPNALNGKYAASKIDIGITTEEAFPSHVLTKIPLLGRVFKGAESAFNGGAMRMRADLMDRVIKQAERNGIDMLDPAQAEPLGRIVNSMTGRGNIGRVDTFGHEINSLIFSVKFLKSNFDTLTAHQAQKGITPYARKTAAINTLKIVGGIGGLMTLANLLKPGSAELDPRSPLFGKIKWDDTTFDITGGMGSLATLAARIVPTMHNGNLGWYSKNRKGEIVPLGTGKFGSQSPLDVIWDFSEGKFAPYAALLRDLWKGEDFQDEKTYVEGHRVVPNLRTVVRAHTPIPAQNFVENWNNPNSASLLMTTILDELGIGANTYTPKPKAPKNPTTRPPSMRAPQQPKMKSY